MKNKKGERFGRLTVINRIYTSNKKNSKWLCRCKCGKEIIVFANNLNRNHTKSCGCLRHETKTNLKHGQAKKTSEYGTWAGMLKRCRNKNDHSYHAYGGRGIKVCRRWLKFENFFEDMGERPRGEERYTIERIDNNGDYTPQNCKWATYFEQANNTRKNIFITYTGKTMTVSQWEKKLNLSRGLLYARLGQLKWSVERALTEPIRMYNK